VRHAVSTLGLTCQSFELPPSFGFEKLKEEGIEAYQAWPHRVNGEGFFVCVMRKEGSAQVAVEQLATKSANKESWFKQLDKSVVPIIQAFIPDIDINRLFMMRARIYLLPRCLSYKHLAMLPSLNYLNIGTELGEVKGKDFIPAHALAMHDSIKTGASDWEMSEAEALCFLRKENLAAPAHLSSGWCRACYRGNGLGWLKVIPGRMNNYLPGGLRVLKK
jgi:NOL1/NOP2/fmu family ribosome biogenesis protein